MLPVEAAEEKSPSLHELETTTKQRIRLALFISSLGCGGAERVICTMANYWAERRVDVTLLTLDHGEPSFYSVHPAVKRRALGMMAESSNLLVGLARNLHRIAELRRAIRTIKPDVVISFMDKNNILAVWATRLTEVPVIVSERSDPAYYDIGRIWGLLRRLSYPFADVLVCQSSAILARVRPMGNRKGIVIPNPVALPVAANNHNAKHNSDKTNHSVIAMGRLVPQKGFDLLLAAFGRISRKHPDWSLTILGEGTIRKELEDQAKSLGVAERVYFAGQTADPFPVLRQADLFVLSSRFEGFPNALCEAMACGLAVVSFDCPSGPAQIIQDGIDGVLAPPEDVGALAATLDRLMGDAAERRRLASCAPQVLERFGVETVMEQWNGVIRTVLSGRDLSAAHSGQV